MTNLKHLAVFIGSAVVLLVSVSLVAEMYSPAYAITGELASLYMFGALIGLGLVVTWLVGESTIQH